MRNAVSSLVFMLALPIFAARAEVGLDEPPAVTGTNEPAAKPGTWNRMMDGMGNGIDSFHDSVSRGILGVVNKFDSFFGENLIDDEDQDTMFRILERIEAREGGKYAVDTTFRARLSLPELKNRVQIVFDDFVENNEEKTVVEEVKDSAPLTGVRLHLDDEKLWHANTDLGLKFRSGNPDVFVRGRVSRFIPMDPWSVKLSEDVYWFARDGFGERTQMRIGRRINHEMLFRATSQATWEENVNGFTLGQDFSIYQTLSARRGVRYSIGAEAPTEPEFRISMYRAQVKWRQLIHGNWLFLDVIPGAEFPDDRDYAFTPFLVIQFDIMFGKPDASLF